MGKFAPGQARTKYPIVIHNPWRREYIMGPEFTYGKRQDAAITGKATVEHLGENRDIARLRGKRRINGLGTVVTPPETNSSISTIGRRAPAFSVGGRTYKFHFANRTLAFEATIDRDKFTKKFKKKN